MSKTKKKAPIVKEEEIATEETKAPQAPAAPFEGGIAQELPKEELKADVVETKVEVLPLEDKVLVTEEDLPKTDEIAIHPELVSPYDEDIQEEEPKPFKEVKGKEWVTDPRLLKKSEGAKDTLAGTQYYGTRR